MSKFTRQLNSAMYSVGERNNIFVVVVLFGLIASFNQWGTIQFSFLQGIWNFVWSCIVIGGSFILVDFCRRVYAYWSRVDYTMQVHWQSLSVGLLLTVFTGGALKVFIGPTFYLKIKKGVTWGRYRRSPNTAEFMHVGLLGFFVHFIIANLAMLGWFSFMPPQAVENLITYNLLYPLFALIPIPPLDGAKIIYPLFGKKGKSGMMSLVGYLLGFMCGFGIVWFYGYGIHWSYIAGFLGAIAISYRWEQLLP